MLGKPFDLRRLTAGEKSTIEIDKQLQRVKESTHGIR